jgi:protein-tyrosine kinase
MSRLDQALQRADRANQGSPQEAPTPTPPAESSALESFPTEEPAPAPAPTALDAEPSKKPPADSALDRFAVTEPGDTRPAVKAESVPPAMPETVPARPARVVEGGKLLEHIDQKSAQKIVVGPMVAASVEQYRRLAATLHHAQNETGVKVIMIASAVAGEGKTLTAANLALTLSESYRRRVLLVDADLRRPTLHELFRLPNTSGLTEGLLSAEERKLPVRQLSPGLSVLTAGRPSADPMSGLTSERMRHILEEAKEAFDWVIIDTPPIGILTDANILARMADAAVFVIRAQSTPFEMVQRAVDILGRDRIIGAVLNGADESSIAGHYYYGGYYGEKKGLLNG